MTYGAVVLAWYAAEFQRRLRERERAALRLEARAATLEAQMQEARLQRPADGAQPPLPVQRAQLGGRPGAAG